MEVRDNASLDDTLDLDIRAETDEDERPSCSHHIPSQQQPQHSSPPSSPFRPPPASSPSTLPRRPQPPSRKRSTQNARDMAFMDRVMEELRPPHQSPSPSEPAEPLTIFAELLKARLGRLSEEGRMQVMHDIEGIVFERELHELRGRRSVDNWPVLRIKTFFFVNKTMLYLYVFRLKGINDGPTCVRDDGWQWWVGNSC